MAWPPNWYITAAFETWVDNTRHCVYNTDVPVHQYMVVSPVKRFPRTRWVWFRGISQQHGVSWHFVPQYTIEQQELGDTLIHTFDIPGWAYCNILYWYMIADKGGIRTPSVSPIFEAHYTGGDIPPWPVPLADPVSWAIVAPRLRTGNRYTFWAHGAWHILVPTPTCLTMWRIDAGIPTRLDQANEPQGAPGLWVDADARLDAIREDIHIGAGKHTTTGTTRQVWYIIFDTRLGTWGVPNLITEPATSSGALLWVNITLDADADPAFWYNHATTNRISIYCIIYNHAIPDPPFPAISIAYLVCNYHSAYHDLVSGIRGVIASQSTYRLRARSRDSLGLWSPVELFTDPCTNFNELSLSANDGHLDIANPGRYFQLDYHRYIPPWDNFPAMQPPSCRFTNAITNQGAPDQLLLVYKDNAGKLAYMWRSPDLAWHVPVQFDIPTPTALAATHAEPDVTSCAWHGPGFDRVSFFAFYDPWAA